MREEVATAIKGMNLAARRGYLVDRGLCPICGEEAAPWYLCWHHRQLGSLRRLLNRFAREGIVTKSNDGHKNFYRVMSDVDIDAKFKELRWSAYLADMKEDDKRTRPRLQRRPIDLDATLMQIFIESGRPLIYEEIIAAWGRLRSKRKTGTLAGDMTKIIQAQRHRENRNAKRATQGPS